MELFYFYKTCDEGHLNVEIGMSKFAFSVNQNIL